MSFFFSGLGRLLWWSRRKRRYIYRGCFANNSNFFLPGFKTYVFEEKIKIIFDPQQIVPRIPVHFTIQTPLPNHCPDWTAAGGAPPEDAEDPLRQLDPYHGPRDAYAATAHEQRDGPAGESATVESARGPSGPQADAMVDRLCNSQQVAAVCPQMHFHTSDDTDRLFEMIPRDCLPENYGGYLPSIEKLQGE